MRGGAGVATGRAAAVLPSCCHDGLKGGALDATGKLAVKAGMEEHPGAAERVQKAVRLFVVCALLGGLQVRSPCVIGTVITSTTDVHGNSSMESTSMASRWNTIHNDITWKPSEHVGCQGQSVTALCRGWCLSGPCLIFYVDPCEAVVGLSPHRSENALFFRSTSETRFRAKEK